MEDTLLSELPVALHVRITSTLIMSTLGTSSAASVTTASYCRINYIFLNWQVILMKTSPLKMHWTSMVMKEIEMSKDMSLS